MREFVFIGQDFYYDSSTIMSSVYELEWNSKITVRSDWGKIQQLLANGYEIHIRQANPGELVNFQRKLIDIMRRRAE